MDQKVDLKQHELFIDGRHVAPSTGEYSIDLDPATEWLEGCVALDKAGFVITGVGAADGGTLSPLQSSVAGVFAVGDARSGSVKRVGGAIGEGAAVVAAIHKFLSHSPGPHL